jgi:valyl-tRNA synthetase
MHTKELDKLYNPKTVEEKWSSYWLEKEFFKADADSGKPAFSMVIPPPNITRLPTHGPCPQQYAPGYSGAL